MQDLRSIMLGLSVAFAAGSAMPAGAQGLTMPDGCEVYATVQNRDCTVMQLYTCEADPQGYQQSMTFGPEGLEFVSVIDSEAQWIRSFSPFSGAIDELDSDNADPASFTELLETGEDTYDFTQTSPQLGTRRYTGVDQLTGRKVTIDGVELEETAYRMRTYDAEGNEVYRAEGHEFISRDWRRFFAGTGTLTTPQDTFDEDGRPANFAFPGEAGFMSTNPEYGCGAILSRASVHRN